MHFKAMGVTAFYDLFFICEGRGVMPEVTCSCGGGMTTRPLRIGLPGTVVKALAPLLKVGDIMLSGKGW